MLPESLRLAFTGAEARSAWPSELACDVPGMDPRAEPGTAVELQFSCHAARLYRAIVLSSSCGVTTRTGAGESKSRRFAITGAEARSALSSVAFLLRADADDDADPLELREWVCAL